MTNVRHCIWCTLHTLVSAPFTFWLALLLALQAATKTDFHCSPFPGALKLLFHCFLPSAAAVADFCTAFKPNFFICISAESTPLEHSVPEKQFPPNDCKLLFVLSYSNIVLLQLLWNLHTASIRQKVLKSYCMQLILGALYTWPNSSITEVISYCCINEGISWFCILLKSLYSSQASALD